MMDYRFQVNITKPGGSASFRVSWLDMEKQADTSFEIPASRVMEERLKSWKKPGKRLAAGQELFKFLDGSQGYFTGLLEKAGGVNRIPLVYINACRETEDWPFELAAQGDRFLVPRAVHLVRCVSRRGVNSKPVPESRPLKLLFMACSAHGVSPDLDFEKEEETIFKVTGNLAVHLEVEDSGSLEGLKNKLALEKYDILHLTGHAAIDAKGKAFFVMEDETGCRRDVYAEELVAAKKNKEEKELCHRAGMEYFQWLKQEKEKMEDYDPVVVEELIYHALGSGEEEIAADEGGGLVGDLTDRLAFMEAQRVGEWILREKKVGLSSGKDAILLNNLGAANFELGRKDMARPYFEKALAIFTHFFGTEHPNTKTVKEWLDDCS